MAMAEEKMGEQIDMQFSYRFILTRQLEKCTSIKANIVFQHCCNVNWWKISYSYSQKKKEFFKLKN